MNVETANRLAQMRKKAGLSQEELADKLGVSRQAVSKWETAESSPDTDNLIALSRIYGVTLDELINGKDETAKEEKTEEKKEPFIHIKGQDGSEVKIGKGFGVHVEDGKDSVHIDASGVHVRAHDDDDDDEDRRRDERYGDLRGGRVFVGIADSLVPLLVVIAYLLLGFLLPNGEGWRNYWVLFFLIPLIPTLIHAIRKRRFCVFAYPVLAVMAYLTVGMFANIWHPTWVIFLTIPIYYSIFGPIDASIHRRSRGTVVIDADVIDHD